MGYLDSLNSPIIAFQRGCHKGLLATARVRRGQAATFAKNASISATSCGLRRSSAAPEASADMGADKSWQSLAMVGEWPSWTQDWPRQCS
jgi:hypothetical protein